MSEWPSVGVVIPTRGRPREVRAAVNAVLAQDYPGELRVAVVDDGCQEAIELEPDARVQVRANTHIAGLAGARNTGVLALETDLIAFCDDDDQWLPGKLQAQVDALKRRPEAEMASCGIVVQYHGHSSTRLIGRDAVRYEDLLRSRMMMVHVSTYLIRRDALIERIGLSDETIRQNGNEDWDLALRAARSSPIAFVDRPLVRVFWGEHSYFAQDWEMKIEGLVWILRRHPEIGASRIGAARVYGQLAFAYACMGQRRAAWLWARRALRRNCLERRVPFALAVSGGLVSGDSVLHILNSVGRGI